jgi:hypothetical protein
MEDHEPPKILVVTWLQLLTQNEDKELKQHGTNMLFGPLGSMQSVANYVKKHSIKIG